MYIIPFGEQERLGTMITNTLHMLRDLLFLPNLRRISIEYANWGLNDIFDNLRLSPFPSQVTELEIKFTTTAGMKNVSKKYHRQTEWVPWVLPSLTHLFILGAPAEFIMDMVDVCPNLQTLEIKCTSRPLSLTALSHLHYRSLIASQPRKGLLRIADGGLVADPAFAYVKDNIGGTGN
jgi:hypothetical protein